jgi:hypothetical protein
VKPAAAMSLGNDKPVKLEPGVSEGKNEGKKLGTPVVGMRAKLASPRTCDLRLLIAGRLLPVTTWPRIVLIT